jgi:tetratricopeptide (TPR) repeat protein
MGYRGTRKNLREISQELRVRHILEGSVRRYENRVRISAKLIDAETDQQLWASIFERDRGDLFAIQAEVAERIAASLEAELSPAERARLAARPTENSEAHDYWLRGNEYNRAGENQPRDPRGISWELAAGMYRRATELDPSFAAAWARLSYQHSRIHWYGYDPRDARLDSAGAALDRALLLDPKDPQVLTATGYHSYRVLRDYDQAIIQYRRAQEDLPGDAHLMNIIALVLRRQGRLREAAELLAIGFESDPRNGSLAEETGNTFRAARAWGEGLDFLDRAIALSPDYPDGYLRKADLLLSWKWDTGAARATLEAGSNLAGEADFLAPVYYLDLFEGRFAEALRRVDGREGELIDEQYNLLPTDFMAGMALLYSGSEYEARERFEDALEVKETLREEQPKDPRIFRALGVIHGALGNSEAAIGAANRAVEMLPMSVDAWAAGDMIENRAWTFTLLGETARALDDLEFLLATPTRSWMSTSLLQVDPRWSRLKDHPRFMALLAESS